MTTAIAGGTRSGRSARSERVDPSGWIPHWEATSSDELAEEYRDLVEALLDCPDIAGFCCTQLADTAHERNGLVNEDRTPQVDPERIRLATSRP